MKSKLKSVIELEKKNEDLERINKLLLEEIIKLTKKDKQNKKELKSELFWYNVLLFISVLATGLKMAWVLTKYNEMSFNKLSWKLAIIITTALSFIIYYYIRRKVIVKKLSK